MTLYSEIAPGRFRELYAMPGKEPGSVTGLQCARQTPSCWAMALAPVNYANCYAFSIWWMNCLFLISCTGFFSSDPPNCYEYFSWFYFSSHITWSLGGLNSIPFLNFSYIENSKTLFWYFNSEHYYRHQNTFIRILQLSQNLLREFTSGKTPVSLSLNYQSSLNHGEEYLT